MQKSPPPPSPGVVYSWVEILRVRILINVWSAAFFSSLWPLVWADLGLTVKHEAGEQTDFSSASLFKALWSFRLNLNPVCLDKVHCCPSPGHGDSPTALLPVAMSGIGECCGLGSVTLDQFGFSSPLFSKSLVYSLHILLGAQDQRLGAEQDQLPCWSTETSSVNCQKMETCMFWACHMPRQPLQNHPLRHLGGWATL